MVLRSIKKMKGILQGEALHPKIRLKQPDQITIEACQKPDGLCFFPYSDIFFLF
jgi:hypothetical protein